MPTYQRDTGFTRVLPDSEEDFIYLSLDVHRSPTGRADKSLWHPDVTIEEEYRIFQSSRTNQWHCQKGNFWGIRDKDGLQPTGKEGERIAKFPKPSNTEDPWHGYPVKAKRDNPGKEFIVRWRDGGIISRSFASRVLRGQI